MVQDDDVKEGHIFDNMLVGDIDNLLVDTRDC